MNLQCVSHGTLTLCVHMGIGIRLHEPQPSEKELSSLISSVWGVGGTGTSWGSPFYLTRCHGEEEF